MVMAKQRRSFTAEYKEQVARMVIEESRAIPSTAREIGVNEQTLRNWVKQARVDARREPGTTSEDRARIIELEREVRELRRANAILRSASAFFAAELDRPSSR